MLHPHWTRQRRGGALDGMSESDSDATDKETGEANLRVRRGESDGKYAAKKNNRHQMPGKGTTSIECRGKGDDEIAD